MYFPWIGFFDLIRLSNAFVHYDDVELTRGLFNRVQVKTPHGTKMLTVPLKKGARDRLINQSLISYESDWVVKHRATLLHSYQKKNTLKIAYQYLTRFMHKITQH